MSESKRGRPDLTGPLVAVLVGVFVVLTVVGIIIVHKRTPAAVDCYRSGSPNSSACQALGK